MWPFRKKRIGIITLPCTYKKVVKNGFFKVKELGRSGSNSIVKCIDIGGQYAYLCVKEDCPIVYPTDKIDWID